MCDKLELLKIFLNFDLSYCMNIRMTFFINSIKNDKIYFTYVHKVECINLNNT